MSSQLDIAQLSITRIWMLAVDAVQVANSGHPGTPSQEYRENVIPPYLTVRRGLLDRDIWLATLHGSTRCTAGPGNLRRVGTTAGGKRKLEFTPEAMVAATRAQVQVVSTLGR